MSLIETIAYLLTWSFIGALTFSLFVSIVIRSGLVYTTRKQDGTLKDKVPLCGIIVMVGFLAMAVGFFVSANYFGLLKQGILVSFGFLFIFNYALFLVLFSYDTLVINGLVLAYWRPGILQLPDEMGRESMRVHILASLPVGLAAGLILAAITTGISWVLFLGV